MTSSLARKDPAMSDADYRMIAHLVRQHCGLHFGPESRFVLERRVAHRLRQLELSSHAAYHYILRSSEAERDELALLIDELTVNETFFFREVGQLHGLIREIIPSVRLERAEAPVSIWCAGCSSGEEPYSVAMLALEAGLDVGRDLRIYASDISRRVLGKARQGVYREASFRETDPLMREKYFTEKDGEWRICDEVRNAVDFVHLNLLEHDKVELLGTMDVILCRNVIIYFDREGKKQVIRTFFDRLRPGGHLLLGHSESLMNLSSDFQLKHLRSDLVYQRPLPGTSARNPWDAIVEQTLDAEDV